MYSRIIKIVESRNFMGEPVMIQSEVSLPLELLPEYFMRKQRYFCEPEYTCENKHGYFSARSKRGDYFISYKLLED